MCFFRNASQELNIRTLGTDLSRFPGLGVTLSGILQARLRASLSVLNCLRHPHPLCAVALPVYGIRGYLCGLLISQAVMALLPSEFSCATF